ncbi:hypothetical protein CRG98_050425 [Punica granatum]|uniref:Reverse transcriptase Ty1/copia-type domain-containing protein n=1 Tax=Punica granatum TaxID=22663 RepID=A0A2I0GBN0_PUNGR|nr:hypothetical protein CRG98_050425 [Punica granatum]
MEARDNMSSPARETTQETEKMGPSEETSPNPARQARESRAQQSSPPPGQFSPQPEQSGPSPRQSSTGERGSGHGIPLRQTSRSSVHWDLSQRVSETQADCNLDVGVESENNDAFVLQRSERNTSAPKYLKDFVDHKMKEFFTHTATHHPHSYGTSIPLKSSESDRLTVSGYTRSNDELMEVWSDIRRDCGEGWEMHQMDEHNAFLHGDLTKEVYLKMSPGLSARKKGVVCRLQKSLYGIRRASCNWYSEFVDALQRYGFQQLGVDRSLFTYSRGNIFLGVLVYVDNLVVVGNSSAHYASFNKYLDRCFRIRSTEVFLGD